MRRARLRFRRLLGRIESRLRWVPEAVLLTLAALIIGGTLIATAVGADWREILRGQALNIMFAALLAIFAYLLFLLRFRQAELTRYLERSHLPVAGPNVSDDPDPLGRTIVDELLDARPPHACLIKSSSETEHSPLLTDIAARLARKRRVPVLVDLTAEVGSEGLPVLTRDRFVTQLVGSSGDAQNARRLYASLVRKQKVVALVRGVDQVGQGKPLAARRAALTRLLEGSLAEGIPFVAWVREDLAPFISEVAAFRARPMPTAELVTYVSRELEKRETSGVELRSLGQPFGAAFAEHEPTRDLAFVHLALDLLARNVRAGDDRRTAMEKLFSDPWTFRRHLAWMGEWTLNRALDQIGSADSPSHIALAATGREAHYQKEPEVSWEDTSRDLDVESRRRFAAGVASLSQRGVVAVSGSGNGRVIRFTHPMWFAFAGTLGLRLDPNRWRDLLQPGVPAATLDAFTGALLTFGGGTTQGRSFIHALEQVGVDEPVISLDMILAAIVAFQAEGEPLELRDGDLDVLRRSWLSSTDLARLRFLSEVDFSRDSALIEFLWEQVKFPDFDRNSFRVRRAICTKLGLIGDAVWEELRNQWRAAVVAARTEDLSSWARGDDRWKELGYVVASLGWTLPGLVLTVTSNHEDAAYDLLKDLRGVVQPSSAWGPLPSRPPEIGLEISLAEGFKAAAVQSRVDLRSCDVRWWSEAVCLLKSAESWISEQALLQALALVASDGYSAEVRDVLRRWEQSAERHLFARDTARLVNRALDALQQRAASTQASQGDVSSIPLPEEDVWFEDQEALEDGGVNLSPEAHRLLGLSTLLINLAEWRFGIWRSRGDSDGSAVDARHRVFSGTDLPKCFRRSNYAATMFEEECEGGRSCPFYLCGPAALEGVVEERRVFSRSFLQRAQATARWSPSRATWLIRFARRAWTSLTGRDDGRISIAPAFESIWRSLDKEIEARYSE